MAPAILHPPDISTSMYFLPRDSKFDIEKPYTCRYDPEGLFESSNIKPERADVEIQDMRPILDRISYAEQGFQVATLENGSMSYEDFDDNHKISDIHIPEVQQVLLDTLGASRIYMVEFDTRRRHKTFPVATGETYQHQQPGTRVHIDFSHGGVCHMMRERWGAKADHVLQAKWQFVNVWHPLRGPLVDWPLALCDASTVDFERDIKPGDVVDRDAFFENLQVHHNERQRWYWLRDQMPSELLVFKNADSQSYDGSVSAGVPHGAFDNPEATPDDFARESIEIRFLVVWDA